MTNTAASAAAMIVAMGMSLTASADDNTVTFTLPAEASVTVNYKGKAHYTDFTVYQPSSVTTEGDCVKQVFDLPANTKYHYTVTMPQCASVSDIFTTATDMEFEFTREELESVSADYCNRDVRANGGYNVADILLNINKSGQLQMEPGATFQLMNLRLWQITNSVVSNYFIEPVYEYKVLNTDFAEDNSVIEISADGLISAKQNGTAIVLVSYHASVFDAAVGGEVWSELWAENTGTFVVTVGDVAESTIYENLALSYKPDDTLDSEHDVLYYKASDGAYGLEVKPQGISRLALASPLVDTLTNTVAYPGGFSQDAITEADDGVGTYTVLLSHGRNILRITDTAGRDWYQVLTVKPVDINVHVDGHRTDSHFLPGDVVKVEFDGLFHVANKLAGVYNQSCSVNYNSTPTSTAPLGNQYQFQLPENQTWSATIVPDEQYNFSLLNGCLTKVGYGSSCGAHRLISKETGVNPSFGAEVTRDDCGSLPDVILHVSKICNGLELSAAFEVGESASVISADELTAAAGAVTWSSDDATIASVSSDGVIYAVKEGQTTVRAANAAGTFAITCQVTVGDPSLGVTDTELTNSISLYPNPFADYITVSTDSPARVELYNLAGCCVMTADVEAGQTELAVSQLPKGVYLVRIAGKCVKMIKA